jgi:LuxR family transcriptional regulator, maltose regulon positive regulatory protein
MAATAESLSPRRIKLRPPRLPGDVVARPRLLARLNRMAALALIIAPAGYGKTTLVGSWLAQTALPFAWLALDETDNDPAMFLAGLTAALATIFFGFGDDIFASVSAPQTVPIADIAMRLINHLNELNDEFILVLDDYHAIRQPLLHKLLVDLVAYPPRAMHLVITSRHDPPLPWRMRNRSGACELRAGDLSFTEDEAAQFLSKATNRPVAAADARTLVHHVHGWITSLRIMALGMRLHTPDKSWSEMADAGTHDVSDYFEREVFADLAPDLLAFLVRTSILDVLNAPLCDFVAGVGTEHSTQTAVPPHSSTAFLHELVRVGAFTEALDDEVAWYRYHPLLKGVLRRRLAQTESADEIAALYTRASAWHEDHELLNEALAYALAGGQVQRAVDFMQRYRQQLLNGWQWGRLERWLQQFPPAAIDSYVELMLARAWTRQWSFSIAEVASDVERIEEMLADLPPDAAHLSDWRGELAALRSQQYVSRGDAGNAIAASQLALANLPPDRLYVRTTSMVALVLGCQMSGEWERTLAHITDYAASAVGPRDLTMSIGLALHAYVDLPQTNLPASRTAYATIVQVTAARGIKTNQAWGHYFWAATCYLQNDLHGAEEHFRAVVEVVDNAHAITYTHSAIGLALTYQAQGRGQEAAAVIEGAQKRLTARQQHHVLRWADAFAAELAARQGRIEEALRWVAREGRQFEHDATPLFYVPGLAFVRVLMAGGSEGDLLAAQYWLELQMALVQRTNNIHAQIQCQVLAAALHEAKGERVEALKALTSALALAEHGQIVRVFADLAAQLAPLFDAMATHQPLTGFAVRVHNTIMLENQAPNMQASAAYERPVHAAAPPTADKPGTHGEAAANTGATNGTHLAGVSSAGERDLQELLTYREMDVLKLLEQRLTNKEIAYVLGISTETVRQHTVNLFRKLNVNNRRQAIVAARNLGGLDGAAMPDGRMES